MFMTVIKCHLLNYDIFNAKMTLFERCLCYDNLTLPRPHKLS